MLLNGTWLQGGSRFLSLNEVGLGLNFGRQFMWGIVLCLREFFQDLIEGGRVIFDHSEEIKVVSHDGLVSAFGRSLLLLINAI